MRPMHGITSGLLLSCLLASAVAAKAPTTPVSHARSLPAVATVADELSEQPIEALQRYQRGLLTRLLLDQGRVAMAQPDALHSAIVLAAVCVVLTERGATASPLSLARATYAIHAAGHAYRTRPSLRAAVSALEESATDPEVRAVFAQLQASAPKLEALGRRWFPEALQAARTSADARRELDLLRGLWLEREGRLSQAAEALGKSVKAKATVASTIDLVRVLAHDGRTKSARKLATRLRTRAPGVGGVLDAVLQGAEDTAATAVYEGRSRPPKVEAQLLQVSRYARLDRVSDAEAILTPLVAGALGQPGVFEAATRVSTRRAGASGKASASAISCAKRPKRRHRR